MVGDCSEPEFRFDHFSIRTCPTKMSLIDISIKITCADPGNFRQGRDGPGSTDRKRGGGLLFFLVFYRGAPNNGYFKEIYNFQDCWGSNIFQGIQNFPEGRESSFFQRRSNRLLL